MGWTHLWESLLMLPVPIGDVFTDSDSTLETGEDVYEWWQARTEVQRVLAVADFTRVRHVKKAWERNGRLPLQRAGHMFKGTEDRQKIQ